MEESSQSTFEHHSNHRGAVHVTPDDIDDIIGNNELVLVFFYATWCRFCELLHPVWDEAAQKVVTEFPTQGQVLLAKADASDQENVFVEKYNIWSYPSIRVFMNGRKARRHDYHGRRTVEAIQSFLKQQIENPIQELHSLEQINSFDPKKRAIIGFFHSKDVLEYDIYRKAATMLKGECLFYSGFGDQVQSNNSQGTATIVYRPDHAVSDSENETYEGAVLNFDELYLWMMDRCIPLVKELTLENAGSLLSSTPLLHLILLYKPDDLLTMKRFKDAVATDLMSEKENIVFLSADTETFADVFDRFEKSEGDLPLIAIEDSRHIYFAPDFSQMILPDKLRTFIEDYRSKTLQRELTFNFKNNFHRVQQLKHDFERIT